MTWAPVADAHRRDAQGSVTILATALAAALLVVAVVAAGLTGLVAAQHRAAAAADLSALAAARQPERACEVAAEVAAVNGADLADCATAGAVVTVEVRIPVQGPLGLRPTITSRARAGPAAAHELGQ